MLSFLARLFVGSLLSFTVMALDFDHPCRTSIRHIESGGIGYNDGYTTFEGFFAPDPAGWKVMPFLDLRAHVINNGKFAANIGGGIRAIAGCRVYGLNAYYDYRNTKRIHDINQGGFGFETLGKRLDFRINGYLPVGKKISSPLQSQFAGFSGHHLMLLQKYNFAMKGFNAELGCHFGKSHLFDFYAAAGTYYFTGKNGPHIWGGKGRLVC